MIGDVQLDILPNTLQTNCQILMNDKLSVPNECCKRKFIKIISFIIIFKCSPLMVK